MSEETEKPSYESTNKERILAMADLIPPREQVRSEQIFREFRLVNADRGRMLFTEWYHDDYTLNQSPEGIRCFTPGIASGLILPDGEVFSGNSHTKWRASLVESHGDLKVTILSMNDGHPYDPMKVQHWAELVSAIKDETIRHSTLIKSLADGIPKIPTPMDFLQYAHAAHLESFRHRPSFREASVVTLF